MISVSRKTKETDVSIQLRVNSENPQISIDTGLPFLDHMLDQLAAHGAWDLSIKTRADLQVDDHHCIEDIAICLGQALYKSWKSHNNKRYGQRLLPMDESLTLCAVDLCGRAYCVTNLPFSQAQLGGINTEMWPHFFYSFAINAQICLHLDNQYFNNNHHLIEGAFKALAYALKEALSPTEKIVSTKGVL
ncbi:MAG: imidazoleglycerol-phosphate dehydratase HisB [Proteobacteria bacterium]|nr:imidazoleglycerol-phosphate dehydratase HisB [Pseudomonadota bacterium]